MSKPEINPTLQKPLKQKLSQEKKTEKFQVSQGVDEDAPEENSNRSKDK